MTKWKTKFLNSVQIEKPLDPVDWSNKYLVLPSKSSAEPGPYNSKRFPFNEEIMNRFKPDDEAEVVVFMKGSQIGATTTAMAMLGWTFDQNPCPVMMVLPTITLAQRTSKQKINPLIEETPALKAIFGDLSSKTGQNSMLEKSYPGGTFLLTGSNSGASLRSMSARYLIGDELDSFTFDVDGEGDPIQVLFSRCKAYGRKRKIFLNSTPTTKDNSHIERWYLAGDQRRYFVPCPFCGEFQTIEWENIKFPDRENLDHIYLECQHCEEHITENYKTQMFENGEWRATSKSTQRGLVSYQLSSLYSPLGMFSWTDCAQELLSAKKQGPLALRAWKNLNLGLPYEEKSVKVDENKLMARRKPYPGEVPEDVYFLTCGVDTQDDRFEGTILGWGKDEHCYVIERFQVDGDPDSITPWHELDEILNRTYKTATGKAHRIYRTFIDSGGHKTTSVIDRCKERPRVFAIKGMDGENRTIVAKSVAKNRQESDELLIVAVSQIKSLLFSRLALEDETAYGYVHFPLKDSIDEQYFKSLVSEKQIMKKVNGRFKPQWIPTYKRNEMLDATVYAYGAMVYSNPQWDSFETDDSNTAKKKPKKKRISVRTNW